MAVFYIRFTSVSENMTIFIFVSEYSRKHDNFYICFRALPETWQFLYPVHKHYRKRSSFYIRFTCTPENMAIFIFGSQALPEIAIFIFRFHALPQTWQLFISGVKHSRKQNNFYIRYKINPGNNEPENFKPHESIAAELLASLSLSCSSKELNFHFVRLHTFREMPFIKIYFTDWFNINIELE